MKAAPDTNPLSLFENLRPADSVSVVDPQTVSDKIVESRTAEGAKVDEQKTDEAPQSADAGTVTPKFFEDNAAEGANNGEAPNNAKPDGVDEEPEELKTLTDPSAENFKKVRGIVKETKKQVKELTAKYQEAEQKLKTYVPVDALIEKDKEIEKLSKWEKLHNLKSSTEYQEKYVAPINEKHTKLKEIFKDYGVPEESLDSVVKEAVGLTNTAQLNSFLSDHFSDQLGAKEAKDLIGSLRTLEHEAKEAEKQPENVLQTLKEQNEVVNQRREAERREQISTTARSAWEESVLEIRKEGQITELIHRDDDPEFNANYPEKLLKQAASEFGKLITEMAKDGAKPSKEVARALARMTLLSQTAGVAIVTRNRAMENAETLTKNATRTNGLFRPTIGGGGRGGSGGGQYDGPPPSKVDVESQLKSDVKGLVNSVLQKR